MDAQGTVQAVLSWLRALADPVGLPILLGFIGRLMWHAEQVQRGRRRWWSWHLAWELVAAIGIGLIADGAAVHAGLAGPPRTGVVVAIAYLGPRGLEHLVARFWARKGGV